MALILYYFKKNAKKIAAGVFCMVVVDLLQLVVPQVVGRAVNLLADAHFDSHLLLIQCTVIVGTGLLMTLLRAGWRMFLMGSSRDLERGIRDELYSHMLSLDMAYYDKTRAGDIMAHATSDIVHVRMAFGFGIIALVDTLFLGSACIGIMVWTSPRLAALCLIPLPFLVLSTKYLGDRVHQYHTTAQEAFSALTEQIRESFFGIRVIKVFNFGPQVRQKTENSARDYFRKNLKRAYINALMRPLLGFFLNLSTLIIILYGGKLVMENRLSPGSLVAFLQYLGILAWPVIAIGWMTNLLQRGTASLKRINLLLNTRSDITFPQDSVMPDNLIGNIRFERVCFSYDKKVNVLSDISLQIPAGARIGITGPPGCGKTTLLSLIPRLYDPMTGRIYLDGKDLKTFDPQFLRRHISFMAQEPFLFSGTLEDNILMGEPFSQDSPRETLDQVIEICALEETIAQMPQGLGSLVGERGVTLSGGQKQRVALARTLLRPKPVVLLDDPVSQLDTRTADRVIRGIRQMNRDAVMVMVSHRLSVLAGCDRIYVMDNGKIADQGTHEQLKASNAFYRTSFKVQQSEDALSGDRP
ncbi:MAG: multidrug ABC transporter ATP-binding protein [Desulfobacter postgatei]|uniref:Multidrug resistance-like ATP-binding protein MdlA n=1 Tax=Desulfobacter postgatei TaxID=2293 RepID=A0A2G6MRJ6_9BACT|nr:MAG: multidrug ABC transporter ATP-binding protein [Desulfobacter postgatei]